jgi:hypothetical protein
MQLACATDKANPTTLHAAILVRPCNALERTRSGSSLLKTTVRSAGERPQSSAGDSALYEPGRPLPMPTNPYESPKKEEQPSQYRPSKLLRAVGRIALLFLLVSLAIAVVGLIDEFAVWLSRIHKNSATSPIP